jgi:hypothetical protein
MRRLTAPKGSLPIRWDDERGNWIIARDDPLGIKAKDALIAELQEVVSDPCIGPALVEE